MSLEGVQVAGGDHAGDFDTQGGQRFRSPADGFDLGLGRGEGGQVLRELRPAGQQLLAAPGHRPVLHLHQVVLGAVGADEDGALGAGDQQLLFQLPVVMRLQLAGAYLRGQTFVP
ncbi:hypothetical protein D9M71_650270 [compost metagenome]